MGGQYGTDPDHIYNIDYGSGSQVQMQTPQMMLTEMTCDMDCDWTDQSTFYVTQDQPLPFNAAWPADGGCSCNQD